MVVDENHQTRLSSTLKGANLAPGSASSLIPTDFKPATKLNVSFGDKVVELGNLLRVSEVKNAPDISFDAEVCHARLPCNLGQDIREGIS